MKRIISTILGALLALPILAQYNGAGFYRIKNLGAAKRYITIRNDKADSGFKNFSINDYKQWRAVNALSTVKDPISDPGSIIYIQGETSNLALSGQGMETAKLLNGYKLMALGSQLCTEYSGRMIYLTDNYSVKEDKDASVGIILEIPDEGKSYSQWEFVPINNEDEYFGLTPEITIDNKYYTTLYTSFAYKLPDGMKAYYVSEHEYSTSKIAKPAAVLKEIGNEVPAGTPVILECTSNKAEDNKLVPIASNNAPTAITNNQLKGIYFCYIKFKFDEITRGESEQDAARELKNVVNYNSSTMRVLGSVNGELALVPAKDNQLVVTDLGKYLPANKAYFSINSSEATATANGIRLLDKESFDAAIDEASAINSITNDETPTTKAGVYTLTGIKVRENNSLESLNNGVYVINGKKFIIK